MNDRPRDDDAHSASDWLASQFGAEEEPAAPPAGTTPPPAPLTPPAAAPPPPSVPPASVLPTSAPPAGGFSWGLSPGGGTTPPVTPEPPTEPPPAAVPPAAVPPAEPPAASVPPAAAAPTPPPPLIEPSEPPPTVAWTPPVDDAPPVAATPPAETTPPADPLPAQPGSWDVPTQLMGAVPPEEAAPAPEPAPEPAPTEPFSASELAETERLGSAVMAQDSATTSALESLFAEDKFRDYEVEPVAATPLPRRPAADAGAAPGQISRTQKILLGVAGGLVAVLALVALFLLGTRLPELIGPAAAPLPSTSPSPSPSPTATELPIGPVDPGVWAWDELLGGECLEDYDDPWAEEFTVVDCAEPHPAQLVYRGVFPPSAVGVTNDPFPGTETLHAQIPALCSAAGVVDLAAAGAYTDVQINGSYPATAEQWEAGDRSYFCFVTRSSGEPLTGTLAVPPPPPAEDAEAAEPAA